MREDVNIVPYRLRTECGLWLLWGSWFGGLVGYACRIIWWHIAVGMVFIEITGLTLMVFLKNSRKAEPDVPENAGSPVSGGAGVIAGAKGEGRDPVGPETAISAGTVVTGTCQIRGCLRVMGRIEGEILAPDGQVCIMPGGEVVGKIDAHEVSIDGRVEGEVKTITLSILSQGHMQGDITMASLTIATGGVFSGVSHRTELPPERPVKTELPPERPVKKGGTTLSAVTTTAPEVT